jgi:protein gp37
MAENSAIEWTDHTFNPWTGCTKVSPGCDGCYAEAWAKRSGTVRWGAGEPRRRTTDANWRLPLKWNRQAEAEGRRFRVFCASLADVFDNQVPDEWRVDLFRLVAATPHLDWLLLTKRIGNAWPMMLEVSKRCQGGEQPMENVWLGATVVNQDEADRDIAKLLAVPARVRFLSMEPLLGPVDLRRWLDRCDNGSRPAHDGTGGVTCPECMGHGHGCTRLHWVIAGGESGPKARPAHPDWFRSLRDQCAAAGVPFLFKQWGEHDLSYDRDRDDPDYQRCDRMARLPGRWINLAGGHGFNGERLHYAHRVGKKAAGRLLDGVQHDGFPEGRA